MIIIKRTKLKTILALTLKLLVATLLLDFSSATLGCHFRKPESVSINRVFGVNKTSVNLYFDNLKTVLNKHNFKAHEIFNCDESGLTCVHKPGKVVAPKLLHQQVCNM